MLTIVVKNGKQLKNELKLWICISMKWILKDTNINKPTERCVVVWKFLIKSEFIISTNIFKNNIFTCIFIRRKKKQHWHKHNIRIHIRILLAENLMCSLRFLYKIKIDFWKFRIVDSLISFCILPNSADIVLSQCSWVMLKRWTTYISVSPNISYVEIDFLLPRNTF